MSSTRSNLRRKDVVDLLKASWQTLNEQTFYRVGDWKEKCRKALEDIFRFSDALDNWDEDNDPERFDRCKVCGSVR